MNYFNIINGGRTLTLKKCSNCDGTGFSSNFLLELGEIGTGRKAEKVECYLCHGTGFVEVANETSEKKISYGGREETSSYREGRTSSNSISIGGGGGGEGDILSAVVIFFLLYMLAALFLGIGQFYNGQVKKGIYFIMIMLVIWFIGPFFIGGLVGLPSMILIIWSMYDAWTTREKMGSGKIPERKSMLKIYLVIYILGWLCIFSMYVLIKSIIAV